MQVILDLMTDNQLLSMERKVWRKLAGDCYHMYGIDERTAKQTYPEELEALNAIRKERKDRNI